MSKRLLTLSTAETDQLKQNAVIRQLTEAVGSAREVLSAAGHYYVSAANGSNANSGTSTSAAWLTPQFAANYIAQNIDNGGFPVTVHMNGTFTSGVNQSGLFVGNGVVTFDGGSMSQTIVDLSATSGSCFIGINEATFAVGNMTCSGGVAVQALDGAHISSNGPILSKCKTADFFGNRNGVVIVNASFTTQGSKAFCFGGNSLGGVALIGITISLSSANFTSAFAVSRIQAFLQAIGLTFVGTATGARFALGENSVIQTNGTNSAVYFPGSALGTNADGSGIYQ